MPELNSFNLLKPQPAEPSTSYVDKIAADKFRVKRNENAAAIAKREDYLAKVRQLSELNARGTSPSAMFNKADNLASDLVGRDPQEVMENAVLAAVPAEQILTKVLGPLARKGIGRVVTNTVLPLGYDLKDKMDLIKGYNKKDLVKAIIDDVPIWKDAKGEYEDKVMQRDVPYRMQFGLEPRYEKDLYAKNVDGSLRFNDETLRIVDRDEAKNLRDIYIDQANDGNANMHYSGGKYFTENPLYNDVSTTAKELEKYLPSEKTDRLTREFSQIDSPYQSPVMGNYDLSVDPANGVAKYYDKWDFALNPGETIIPQKSMYDNRRNKLITKYGSKKEAPSFFGEDPNFLALRNKGVRRESMGNLARYLMDKITLPVEIKGAIRY